METLVNVPFAYLMQGATTDSFVVYSNGGIVSFPLSVALATTGVVSLTVTPSGTGYMQVMNASSGLVSDIVNVVGVLSTTTLSQIQGASMGSFMWDKSAGTLTLYTTTGATLSSYSITDQPTVFSRELLP